MIKSSPQQNFIEINLLDDGVVGDGHSISCSTCCAMKYIKSPLGCTETNVKTVWIFLIWIIYHTWFIWRKGLFSTVEAWNVNDPVSEKEGIYFIIIRVYLKRYLHFDITNQGVMVKWLDWSLHAPFFDHILMDPGSIQPPAYFPTLWLITMAGR